MTLWIFGLMVLGSVFIVGAWGRQAYKHRHPLSHYNAALLLAVGFDLHAVGTAVQTGVRVYDVFSGLVFGTELPSIYLAGSLLVIAGKSLFVWIAALKEGRDYSRGLWWSYVSLCAAWSGFAATWGMVI